MLRQKAKLWRVRIRKANRTATITSRGMRPQWPSKSCSVLRRVKRFIREDQGEVLLRFEKLFSYVVILATVKFLSTSLISCIPGSKKERLSPQRSKVHVTRLTKRSLIESGTSPQTRSEIMTGKRSSICLRNRNQFKF